METAIIFVTLRVLSSNWNTFGLFILVRVTGGRSEIKTMILAERDETLSRTPCQVSGSTWFRTKRSIQSFNKDDDEIDQANT